MTEKTIETATDSLLTVGAAEYLKGVRSEMLRLLARTDQSLREQLGQVYAAAEYLRDDEDQWQTFCEQDEWLAFKGRPKVNSAHRNDALRFAIRFAVGFDGVRATTAVHRYNAALKAWWSEGVPAAKIPHLLQKQGGIEKMKRANAGGTLLKLKDNRYIDQITKESRQFDAILLVRFLSSHDGTREAEILAGVASVGEPPKLEDFRARYRKWCDKEIALKNQATERPLTTL